MTERTMLDSVALDGIPFAGQQLVAVYRNGAYAADPDEAVRRFPPDKYVIVWIDVNGTAPGTASVLDVERYDATPAMAPGWIAERHRLVPGSLPTIYGSRSTKPAVIAACTAAGLKLGRDWWLWIATGDGTQADLDGTPLDLVAGVVACQDKWAKLTGGNWDSSVVYESWWHSLPPVPVTAAEAQAAAELLVRYAGQG